MTILELHGNIDPTALSSSHSHHHRHNKTQYFHYHLSDWQSIDFVLLMALDNNGMDNLEENVSPRPARLFTFALRVNHVFTQIIP